MRYRFLLVALILLLIIGGNNRFLPSYEVAPPTASSSIGTKEDPQARVNYELRMLADPKTGNVPSNIRQRELLFSQSIPDRESFLKKHNLRVSLNNYQLAGPGNIGGRTRAAAFDVRDEEVIVAGGVSGGIWKSVDGGDNWQRTSDPLNRNSVTSLAQDTREGHENTWYYTTGELLGNSARTLAAPYRGAGIYKSSDNANSWSLLASTSDGTPNNFSNQFQYVWRITTNHTNLAQDEVMVAAYGGILRSVDGGQSWSAVLGQELFNLPEDTDLNCSDASFYTEIQKSSTGNFFAALSSSSSSYQNDCEGKKLSAAGGFYYSADGIDWENITPPSFPSYFERTVIGLSANEQEIYFLTVERTDENDEDFYQFWRFNLALYLNGNALSACWDDLTGNIPNHGGEYGDFSAQGGYNLLVQGHPENNNVIYIGGTNLYRSTTGFSTRGNADWIGGYDPENDGGVYEGHYPDQHLLLFYPSNANRMISANDGGLRITNNNLANEVSWESLNNGYLTTQFYTIAQEHGRRTDAIIGGMQDNGTYLRNGADIESPSWKRILGGDGGYAAITPNQSFFYVSFQKGQIYRLTLNEEDQLTTFTRVDPEGAGDVVDLLFINPYVLDPENASRMYFTGGDMLWRNENLMQIPGGLREKSTVNWTKLIRTRLSSGLYTSIAKSRTGDILLAGVYAENTRIVKVTKASEPDYDSQNIFSDHFPEFGHIACIAINPENEDHFLVVFSNYNIPSLFMTEDGGESFSDVSGNLEESPDGTGAGPSARWAEIIPTTDGLSYYVGTSTGLYSTSQINGSNTVWTRESEELIGNSIITMMDYRAIDGRLVVATHGNGTFRGFIENPKPESNGSEELSLSMSQNYPNPFRTATYIDYTLPDDATVKIDIVNSSGQLIKHLLWGPQFAGSNRVIWDGTNTTGGQLRAGVYYAVLTYGKKQITKRMVYQP